MLRIHNFAARPCVLGFRRGAPDVRQKQEEQEFLCVYPAPEFGHLVFSPWFGYIRAAQKLQFLNSFALKMTELAAICGKFHGTCEITGRLLNKSIQISGILP
jgi:hypothetical protein